jgi:hypothetical protein
MTYVPNANAANEIKANGGEEPDAEYQAASRK